MYILESVCYVYFRSFYVLFLIHIRYVHLLVLGFNLFFSLYNYVWKMYIACHVFSKNRYPELQNTYFQICFHTFPSIVWSIFVMNKGPGSIFGHIFGGSKNYPNSIAMCPGVKISHLGIIKRPKNLQIYIKNLRKNKQIAWIVCRILGPIQTINSYTYGLRPSPPAPDHCSLF